MNSIWFFIITFFAISANAQQVELFCRNKAKEVARETYSSCVTEARQGQINQIREEYQSKLADLKSHYDKELKKIAGKNVSTNNESAQNPSNADITLKSNKSTKANKLGKAEKPIKGVAKSLPAKANNNGPALPVQTVSEEPEMVSKSSKSDISEEYGEPTEIVEVPADN